MIRSCRYVIFIFLFLVTWEEARLSLYNKTTEYDEKQLICSLLGDESFVFLKKYTVSDLLKVLRSSPTVRNIRVYKLEEIKP